MNSFRFNDMDVKALGKHWHWFLVWGMLLIVLGIFAVSATTVTSIVSVGLLGLIILFGGIVVIADAITFWWRRWPGFFIHLLMGILYVAVGSYLIKSPLEAAIYLTLILGFLYLILGIFRIIYALIFRVPSWGWYLFNAVVTLLLGLLILSNWPTSGLYIIGLFIGIDLFFLGLAYVMGALAVHSR